MKLLKIVILLLVIVFFQCCSWQEYFVITNQTNTDITIEYEIELPKSRFGIFDNHPITHKLTSSGDINWNETIEAHDSDTSKNVFKIILTQNTALTIGHLSNDNYKKHDQYFINGRTFNLKKLSVTQGKIFTEITPKNFDDYFKKKNGMIFLRTK